MLPAACVDAADVHEVLALMEIGARSKVVAANTLNARSSRSHTLFTVTVKRTVRELQSHGTPPFARRRVT